jgi:Family of unknown function (DUF5764)
MDDFNISSLHESRNEWCARLLSILTPLLVSGFRSIFDESYKLCRDNNEVDKYLMTFQNLIARIPKWNSSIIEQEKKRIIEQSHCNYLEDLVTCVHIIQLKILTAMRVSHKQKKIDINIPKLEDFIHKSYIHVARKIYKNVFLFEINLPPLQVQKHNRELEMIVQECILDAIRESIPIESILRAYMDDNVEEEIIEEVREVIVDKKEANEDEGKEVVFNNKDIPETTSSIEKSINQIISESTSNNTTVNDGSNDTYLSPTSFNHITASNEVVKGSSLTFADIDRAINENNKEELINAPKTIERLEQISSIRASQDSSSSSSSNDESPLRIGEQDVSLDILDIHEIGAPKIDLQVNDLLSEVEVLA